MFPTKRAIEQSLRRNGFSASEAKKHVTFWSNKGLLDPANWDAEDNFIPDMKATSRVTSDLLRRADKYLN